MVQYMAGGDLSFALSRDLKEEEKGGRRRLDWYASGKFVLLSVACGLAYLHSQQVCPFIIIHFFDTIHSQSVYTRCMDLHEMIEMITCDAQMWE